MFGNIDLDSFQKLIRDQEEVFGPNTGDFLSIGEFLGGYNAQDWDRVRRRLNEVERNELMSLIDDINCRAETEFGMERAVRSQLIMDIMIGDIYALCMGDRPRRRIYLTSPYVASDIQLGGNNGLLEAFVPDHSLVLQSSI